jgi:hypothetical protein
VVGRLAERRHHLVPPRRLRRHQHEPVRVEPAEVDGPASGGAAHHEPRAVHAHHAAAAADDVRGLGGGRGQEEGDQEEGGRRRPWPRHCWLELSLRYTCQVPTVGACIGLSVGSEDAVHGRPSAYILTGDLY